MLIVDLKDVNFRIIIVFNDISDIVNFEFFVENDYEENSEEEEQ